MSHDGLGLFDTPPDRRQLRIAFAVVAVPILLFPAVYAVRDIRTAHLDSFIPIVDSILAVGDLVTFVMLLAQAAFFRSRALAVLAVSFLYMAILFAMHALTFPGAFAPDGLFGAGINTTAWLTYSRRIAFPVAVILYVLLRRRDEAAAPAGAQAGHAVAAAVALAGAASLVATAGHDLLPSFYFAFSTDYNLLTVACEVAMAVSIVAAALVLLRDRRTILDLWLLVALSSWLFQTLIVPTLVGRFTIGWYYLNLMLLVSNLTLLLVLIAETGRLNVRLAASCAERNRERGARAIAMNAVAGVISHRVGQPLTAVSLNASAGLDWLQRDRPDIARSVESLRLAIEAGRQAQDILARIRASFAQGRGALSAFCLNELVRETATLFGRELDGETASLSFAFDEALPWIQADRLQLQMVLVNLFANAIESLGATEGRPRRIEVRTALLDGEDVMLEVSDTGIGFAADQAASIFEAFYTTKAAGAGLGLPVCRTIVESHGGRLWASPGEGHGATFHMLLPRSRLAA
jgi:signal transduction histidine kinase